MEGKPQASKTDGLFSLLVKILTAVTLIKNCIHYCFPQRWPEVLECNHHQANNVEQWQKKGKKGIILSVPDFRVVQVAPKCTFPLTFLY